MKILDPTSYRVMPWKNGYGLTTEIYVQPQAGEFQWRVSIADVERDGPFSRFAGYDRHIMLVEGHGMVLEGGPEGPIGLTTRFEARSFAGEWNMTSRLIEGPVRDFNLMTRRNELAGRLEYQVIDQDLTVEAGPATILCYVLSGDLSCEAGDLHPQCSLLVLPTEKTHLKASSSPVQMVVCRITPLTGTGPE